jgi:hypothetical protein
MTASLVLNCSLLYGLSAKAGAEEHKSKVDRIHEIFDIEKELLRKVGRSAYRALMYRTSN